MTLEEYVNTNLHNAILRGFTKDGEITLRLKGIEKRNIKVSFVSFVNIPDILRVDIPTEGIVLTFVGKLSHADGDIYIYTAFEKVGILQRRSKPRYASFEPCQIFQFRTIIIDVSENGCQVVSEYKPKLREEVEIKLENGIEKAVVMWYVEEEESFRYGMYIPEPGEAWNKVCEKYIRIGEKL